MARIVSFAVLIAIIVLIGVLFFRVMAGFWLPLFLAALLVVIFKPVHNWILGKCHGRVRQAAIFTTLTIFMVVLAPMAWTVVLAVSEAANIYARPRDAAVQERVEELRTKLHLELPFPKLLNDIEYNLQRLHPDREEDTILWENYPWPAAERRVHAVEQSMRTLLNRIEVDYAPKAPDLSRDERVRREASQNNLQQAVENIEQLQLLFRPPTDAMENTAPNGQTTPADDAPAENNEPAENETPPPLDGPPTSSPSSDAALTDAHPAPPVTEPPDPEKFLELLSQADLRYRTFRQTLLGGPVKAWLVELANPSEEELRQLRNRGTSYVQRWLLSITGQTTALLASLIFGLCIMIISVYYFLIDGPNLIKAGMRLSPLDDQYERELLAEFDKISRAVVLATLLSAVVQGLLATIGFFFAGVHSLFLLFILTTLLAMVPFVGSAAVWVPVCLWLAFVDGRIGAAIGLGIWGGVVVSMADNVIKPWVLHGQSNLHPLLALLSVLGGVQALGPIGILVGPMVVSFLQALLNILNTELSRMGERR